MCCARLGQESILLAPAVTIRRDSLDLVLVRAQQSPSHQHQMSARSNCCAARACWVFLSSHIKKTQPHQKSQRARIVSAGPLCEKRFWTQSREKTIIRARAFPHASQAMRNPN